MLECLLEVFDALGVLDLVEIDRLRCIYVDQDFPVHVIVDGSLVPEWIHHDNVLASLQL